MALAVVDTNVLVRHVTRDPPDQARRATHLLETSEEADLVLPDAVLAELVFVLQRNYGYARDIVYLEVLSLLAFPSLYAPGYEVLLRALRLFSTTRLHFVDAYAVATAEVEGLRIASFDRGFDRIPEIERIEP